MANDYPCGAINLVDGGVLRGVSILNSQITDSTISNSILSSSSITSLSNIDAASAQKIADAIAALPTASLVALAEALRAALATRTAATPVSSSSDELPREYYGDRDKACGDPDLWGAWGDGQYAVPLYRQS